MTSISEMFPKSLKLVYDARQALAQVQNGALPPWRLVMTLDELNHQLDQMETILGQCPQGPSAQPACTCGWPEKVAQLRSQAHRMRLQSDKWLFAPFPPQAHRDDDNREEEEDLMQRGLVERANSMWQTNDESVLGRDKPVTKDRLGTQQAPLFGPSSIRPNKDLQRTLLDWGIHLGVSKETMKRMPRLGELPSDAHWILGGGMLVTVSVLYLWNS